MKNFLSCLRRNESHLDFPASNDFKSNLNYLLEAWSVEEAIDFNDQVVNVIDLICDFPQLYPKTNYRELGKAVINKRITLFYKVNNEEITLMRFWNNYQDPEKIIA